MAKGGASSLRKNRCRSIAAAGALQLIEKWLAFSGESRGQMTKLAVVIDGHLCGNRESGTQSNQCRSRCLDSTYEIAT